MMTVKTTNGVREVDVGRVARCLVEGKFIACYVARGSKMPTELDHTPSSSDDIAQSSRDFFSTRDSTPIKPTYDVYVVG
jgi:hypothetical protein